MKYLCQLIQKLWPKQTARHTHRDRHTHRHYEKLPLLHMREVIIVIIIITQTQERRYQENNQKCYVTAMIFRPCFGVRMFFRIYFSL